MDSKKEVRTVRECPECGHLTTQTETCPFDGRALEPFERVDFETGKVVEQL